MISPRYPQTRDLVRASRNRTAIAMIVLPFFVAALYAWLTSAV